MFLGVRRKPERFAAALLPALALIFLLPLAGGAAPGPGQAADGEGDQLTQVGFLPIPGFNADVWAHNGFAYVGCWGRGTNFPAFCPARGVQIIDLSDPAAPKLVGAVAAIPGTSQEDVVVRRIETAAFQGDLLVTGIQAAHAAAPRGLDLWDVTDPRQPRHLAFWSSGPSGRGRSAGVHELHLFQRGERAYVAAAVPWAERAEGQGEFRLVDVTDPRHPVQVSDWALHRDGGGHLHHAAQSFFCHSATTNEAGTIAILSYWDAGAIFLDITDPARPAFIGRTRYPAGADGDTHSVWLARGETLLLTADEDFQPENGSWGFLRIWDITDLAQPVEISNFATRNARAYPPPDAGTYSIHNPFVRGETAYLAWYSDGVRVVDISQPWSPREVASFVPPPTRDPFGYFATAAQVWGVYVEGDLVLASDINAGLYVLRHTRGGTTGDAPAPPSPPPAGE